MNAPAVALAMAVKHPSLYQLNTRVLLHERGVARGRPATLDDFDDAFLDRIADRGFQWVWLLGVWQTGPAGRDVSRADPALRTALRSELPDLREDDITGSPFAVRAYETHRDFGGDRALAKLRERLARRKLRLLLDFVPNHTAIDHAWVDEHPEYYIHGSAEDLARQPQNYLSVKSKRGGQTGNPMILAHGRDPYFDGWRDTLQLNYRHAGFREAQIAQLGAVADRCDGLRCDMAMLLEPEIIARTWGVRALPSDGSPSKDDAFWPEAIAAIRRRHPGFQFIAEVYWDMEYQLQQHGFDYTYDKRLYDRLHDGSAGPVRGHLQADPGFQDRSLRFLENHDEPRAASAFPREQHQAAAVVTFMAPGLRFFHEGQLEGRKVHVSMHVGRRPDEPVDEDLQAFYGRLLEVLQRPEAHDGAWQLLTCWSAWSGNSTHEQFIASAWQTGDRRLLSVVNYGPTQGQCYVTLPLPGLGGRMFTLVDLLGEAQYRRSGDELATRGLYLDMPAWGRQIFDLRLG